MSATPARCAFSPASSRQRRSTSASTSSTRSYPHARPARLTQTISRRVYECAADGAAQFAGIRYLPRLGDELVNWAVFERTEQNAVGGQATASLDSDDRDLRSALEHLGLALG